MYNKFSDKDETNENLQLLDKQLKNIFEIVINKEKQIEKEIKANDEVDPALTRKPLGGFSCASCSKQVNMCNAQQMEHFSWSKLPIRDPTDRISRVGQGFSKMLSSIKTKVEVSKTLNNSKEMKTHLKSTDLQRDEFTNETIHVPTSIEDKSRNKHLSPFRTFDIAQRTARERKVKKLDKVVSEKKFKDDYQNYLPNIIKSSPSEDE